MMQNKKKEKESYENRYRITSRERENAQKRNTTAQKQIHNFDT